MQWSVINLSSWLAAIGDVSERPYHMPIGNRQLTFKELRTLKGIRASKMTIWRWMKAKTFPQSYRTPGGTLFWKEQEIDAWLAKLQHGKGWTPPRQRMKKAG